MKKRRSPKEKAGVVVYRRDEAGTPLVLVISARKFKNQWVFPVGSVEKNESLEAAAKRECEEESGYIVDLGLKLSSVEVVGKDNAKRFTFFLATIVGEADKWETDRKRKWVPASKLVDMLPDVFQSVAHEAVEHIMK
jgi:8-oxo-dGTP pyrophosphatase MutT (NUDIX family)